MFAENNSRIVGSFDVKKEVEELKYDCITIDDPRPITYFEQYLVIEKCKKF